MTRLKKFLYRYFIYPLILLIAHLAALFNKNIREALKGRYQAAKELKAFRKTEKPVVYFHAASLGEFEHIRPLIYYLGQNHQVVVTFFSPSGYNHAKKQFEDEYHFYLPFDFYGLWLKIFKALQPEIMIISKHDIWANQIMAATKSGIPTYLVNASLSAKSSRLNPLYRSFYRPVYQKLSAIFTISEEDRQRFEKNFDLRNVKVVGDTKFDQVIIRKEQAKDKTLLPGQWVKDQLVIALGSIWPEDYRFLSEPLQRLMQEFDLLKILFVPHQPHEDFLKRIENDFGKFGMQRFSEQKTLSGQRCLIVNVVGILADLYQYAGIAYIGGSFKQGIHNVMEAAVYGIPVLYGPMHENSYEATQLITEKAAFVVRQKTDVYSILKRLIEDEDFRTDSGRKVQDFVTRHTGATQRILRELGFA